MHPEQHTRTITFLHEDAIFTLPGVDPERVGKHYAELRRMFREIEFGPQPPDIVGFEYTLLPDGGYEIHLKETFEFPIE